MLKFKKITDIKDVKIIERYTSQTDSHFSNMINSVFFAWTKVYPKEYCIYNGALIIKEFDYRNDNSCEFYLPIGKNALGAIKKIVEYAQKENKDLVFSCLTEENIEMLSSKFPVTERGYDRRWSDYIYLAEDMRTFKGKKYAGQRNHINKFEKLYGSYEYKVMTKESIPEVLDFLREFGKYREFVSESEVVEYKLCFDIINNMFELGMVGGYIVNNGKIVAISVGEVRNDMLYIAIEKASRFHEGAYQVMVREFARHNTGDIVKYINREDDSGDEGLRTSKLQYKPIEIKHKHFLKIGTLFERFVYPVEIHVVPSILTILRKKTAKIFDDCARMKGITYIGVTIISQMRTQAPRPNIFLALSNA